MGGCGLTTSDSRISNHRFVSFNIHFSPPHAAVIQAGARSAGVRGAHLVST